MYRVFYFKKKATLSIPLKPNNVRMGAFNYVPGGTLKKNFFKVLIKLFTKIRIESLVSQCKRDPVPMYKNFKFTKWLKQVEVLIGVDELFAVVSFPSIESRKRFYVHLFDRDGKNIGFSKISRDEINDKFLLKEMQNVRFISSSNVSFKVPNVISKDYFNNHVFVVYEPIPHDTKFKSLKWGDRAKQISNELNNFSRYRIPLSQASWIKELSRVLSENEFKDFLGNMSLSIDNTIEVCFSHGDLHNGNLRYEKDNVWVFDWESARKDAPIMTDEISFYLGTIQKLYSKSPKLVYKDIYKKYIDGNNECYIKEVGLALAFLSAMDRVDAKSIILNWKYIVN